MSAVTIKLDEQYFGTLKRVAEENKRSTKAQAEWMLEDLLRGLNFYSEEKTQSLGYEQTVNSLSGEPLCE